MSAIDSIAEIFKDIAPPIATALGSPVAGLVVSALASHIGTANSPEAVLTHLTNNPYIVPNAAQGFLEHHGASLTAIADAMKLPPAAAAVAEQLPNIIHAEEPLQVDAPVQAEPVQVDKGIVEVAEDVITQAKSSPFCFLIQLGHFKFCVEWTNQ